jgi:hypothetical protein
VIEVLSTLSVSLPAKCLVWFTCYGSCNQATLSEESGALPLSQHHRGNTCSCLKGVGGVCVQASRWGGVA